jgi:hypothetical protein
MVKAGTKVHSRRALEFKGAYAKFLAHFKRMPYYNPYVGARFVDENGLPCQQPPWGLLSAVNTHTGHIAWKVRLGDYPALAQAGVPATGTPNLGGSMVTASALIFIGATMDGDFRAFDARTGRLLWEAGLDGYGEATPMTYVGQNGKQYVVIAAGDAGLLRGVHHSVKNPQVRLIAFALGGRPSAPTKASRAESAAIMRSAQPVASGKLPPGAGRLIVQEDCTLCHGVENITRSHLGRAGWQATVREMMNRGAPVTTAQYQALIEYLTHNFGPSSKPR